MGNNLVLEIISNINIESFHSGDAGIDLPCPYETVCKPKEVTTVKLGVRCQLIQTNVLGRRQLKSYFLVPRSSICKSPLAMVTRVQDHYGLIGDESNLPMVITNNIDNKPLFMVNIIGIIDSGYTGELMFKVYNYSDKEYVIKKGDRVVQIITANLERPNVVLVDSLSETSRGENGFGSTNDQ